MKNLTRFSFCLLLPLFFASCTSTLYQVQSTAVSENDEQSEAISMDLRLWTEGGKLTAYVYNNTDQPVYIDWLYSTLSINESAIPLYNETSVSDKRVISFSNSWWNASNTGVQSGKVENSSSYEIKNNRVDIIPPYSYRERTFFSGYLGSIYDNCDLSQDVDKGSHEKSFTEFNTPFSFSTMIGYCNSAPDCDAPSFIYKDFYVDQIVNMSEKEFKGEASYLKDCNGKKDQNPTYSYPYTNDDSYYFSMKDSSNSNKGVGAFFLVIGLITLTAITVVNL